MRIDSVCNREYRVSVSSSPVPKALSLIPQQETGARFLIGVNPQGGAIFWKSRLSPESQARIRWNTDVIRSVDMPLLRASSDVAWCFWNRAQADPGNGSIRHIKYFIVANLVNSETQRLVKRAVASLGKEEPDNWPGNDFSTDTEEGQALLGVFC